MDSAEFTDQVEEVLYAALQLHGEDRARFLTTRCAADQDMRQEVESLLAAHERARSFIEPPDPASAAIASPRGRIGSRVGPFRLVDLVGEGGMGSVFRAERADGDFSQQVAIKFVGSWLRSASAAQRFRAERQILASLQHPHIVALLDGGVTAEGDAYLVMEFVDGQPITAYCQERRLSLERRLRLFAEVCAAVQFAHAHLVVHRDLKPANIVVTAEGVPKVLDFGVAKLLEPSGGQMATLSGLWPGPLTPNYASPEQLRGVLITTVSDVYALGVLLYELLTGSRPYETAGKPINEVFSLIVEADAAPPSTVQPPVDIVPTFPRSMLSGDLDAIVLKAMQKDPARRYASAGELADDVTRYLDGRTVLARPDRAAYRVRKFVRRHRVAVAAMTAAVLSLVVGLAAALWQANAAGTERDRARLEAAKAEHVSAFLRALFISNEPRRALGRALTAEELLESGVERIDRELGGQPELQASMLATLGSVYSEMGLGKQALPLLERSLAMREGILGPEHADVAESLRLLGRLKNRNLADWPSAEQLLRRALAIRERLAGADDPLLPPVLSELGLVLRRRGQYEEGRNYLRRAVAIDERTGSIDLQKWLSNLSLLEQQLGDFESAEKLLRRALELGIQTEGRGIPVDLTMINLGTVLRDQEQFEEARALIEEVNALEEKTWGTGKLYTWGQLGDLYFAMGDHQRAREFLDKAIAIAASEPGKPDPYDLASPLVYSGRLLLAEGKPREALQPLERALRIREKVLGPKHNYVATVLLEIARATAALNEPEVAERTLQRALAMQRETLVAGHRFLVPTLLTLGDVVRARGDAQEAQKLFAEALEIARHRLPEHHSQRRQAEAAAHPLAK